MHLILQCMRLTYSPLLRLFMVWILLCHLIWPCQDFLPPLFRLLMILFGSDSLVLMLLRLPLPNLIHRWPSMLTNIVVIFLYMWVILFMCQLSISHCHASYLVSSLHVGLDLFPSVALFPRLRIILICRRSMGASTLYSMLVISVLIWDQFLLALHNLFHSMIVLLVNLKSRIF